MESVILPVLFIGAIIFALFYGGKSLIKRRGIKVSNENTEKPKTISVESTSNDWRGLMLIAGIGLCLYAFFMDTSVAVPGGGFMGIDRVNNFGLMNDRMMYFIVGIVIVFSSIMVIVFGQKKDHKITVTQTDIVTQLKILNDLKEKGAITEEEYQELKKKLLNDN